MCAIVVTQATLRSIDLIPNMRSFGGIPCSGGKVVRNGLIYRSASPANVSAEDVVVLSENLKLRSIIDLRAQKEGEQDVGPRHLQRPSYLQNGQFPVRPLPSDDTATWNPRATYHVNLLNDDILRKGIRQLAMRRPRLLLTLVLLGGVSMLLPSKR